MGDNDNTGMGQVPETRATGTFDERDALTGVRGRYVLLNEYDYDDYMGREVYVVLCDLDNFRMVNDAYGENEGNELLARIGQTIQSCFGDKRTFRYGSDEFLVVNAFYNEDAFLEKLDNLDRQIAAIDFEGTPLHLTCSYGYVYGKIATRDDLHEAIRLADRKMYEAKRLGKSRAVGVSLEDDPMLAAVGHRQDKLYKSYETDELTGLANLIYFRNALETLIEHQRESEDLERGDRIALVYLNVQNFKGYNEMYGFDAGDELLVLIGDAIRDAFPGRLAARFSADQFMVAATVNGAERGFLRVRQAFRQRQKDSSIWLKAGIYIPADDGDNIGVDMDRAKLACDSIKGRRDVYFRYYDAELQSQIRLHRYVLEHLEQAFQEHWIKVFYQPIVRVATGEVCDEEALARWVDPDRGIIPPMDFIPVLEEARLIHRLDLHIVHRVCENLSSLRADGLPITPVSVNLSRLDFELCDIVEEIEAIMDDFELEYHMITIEVTESALSGNQEFLKGEIDRFRADGFEVWMDDFGSGYSSLNLLKEYYFDLLKIDMGFLRGFEKNEHARVILSHMIGMAKELGLKTLVEGVETEDQRNFLSSIGCGRAQGFLFGRPISLDEMREQLISGTYLKVEPPERHRLYEAVGRVNLLRPDPSEPIDGHYVPGDIPAAIIRCHEGKYEYLNVSDVYRTFLEDVGVSGIEESAAHLNDDQRIEHLRLVEGIESSLATGGGWAQTTYHQGGQHCAMRVKCIVDNPEEDMVVVVVVAGVKDEN